MIRENVHHFNWIEFTMKLRKENTQMPSSSDGLLKEGHLVLKVILLAEEVSHAAAFILNWANGGALGPQPSNIEATLLKCLLKPFWLTILECHFLLQSTITWVRVVHRDYCVLSFPLFSAIHFIHVESA